MPTEHAFWESNRYFRLLVENASDYAIFSLDLDGRITTWNRGAERLLGWSKEEAIGRSGKIVFTEKDRADDVPKEEMARAAREGRSENTRWHVRKGGERFWASGILEAVRSEAGELLGFAKILRDRTETKRYEEALEQSNRNLAAFAGHVAHEVRSPLMGIRLVIASLLRKHSDVLDEETLEMAREVQASIRDLDRFTTDLLSYSRLGEGRRLADRQEVASEEAFREALSDLKPLIEERRAEVEVEAAGLPTVSANPSLLRHLFRNLIANAIEHNDADVPRVWVEVSEEADAWRFRVADNGTGIAETDRERIFEFFQRGTREAPGVGIGLALSRRIVEAHGGQIGAEPGGPEGGSIFFFTLPRNPEHA